ncbi:MAG: hypothetical protein AAB276_00510 [Pseudomonadota bacterium]
MTRLADIPFPDDVLTTPVCPHFEECGSCQLQHIQESAYRDWKVAQLDKLLLENKITPDVLLPPVFIGAGERRRVTVSVFWQDSAIQVGFNKFHAHELVIIKKCLLLTPPLQNVIDQLPVAMAGILPRGSEVDMLIQDIGGGVIDCLITGMEEEGSRQTGRIALLAEMCGFRRVSFRKTERDTPVPQIVLGSIAKVSGSLSIDMTSGAFLQPSIKGEDALVAAVMAGLKGVGKKDKVADLFAGCGSFAGRILERTTVHAVEGDDAMAAALVKSGGGQAKFSAEQRDLFKEPISVRELRGYRAIVIDPPRAGAKEQTVMLAKSDVAIVVSVSCNPATFARDTKTLIGGGYKFISLQMIDQFTWSTHCEVVGVFKRG